MTSTTVAKSGYQNFGSFHTENVQDLVAQDAGVYQPPALPFQQPAAVPVDWDGSFGSSLCSQFCIDLAKWVFLNHGAFGGVCRAAQAEASLWRDHCESQPLTFIDRELFPHVVRVTREIAGFMSCRPQDVVFVPNATTGLNTVIKSIQLGASDSVYMLNIGYGSVKKMLQCACEQSGAEVVYGDITFPIQVWRTASPEKDRA